MAGILGRLPAVLKILALLAIGGVSSSFLPEIARVVATSGWGALSAPQWAYIIITSVLASYWIAGNSALLRKAGALACGTVALLASAVALGCLLSMTMGYDATTVGIGVVATGAAAFFAWAAFRIGRGAK
jgi:hypothetical protein